MEQAKVFLKHENQFGNELYAIIGYFGFYINKIDGFSDDLEFGDIFGNQGVLQEMLSTSKRFTDQLVDMLNLDRSQAGPDTLKEMENGEENEPRIARIFHDVAKGQVLESFVNYAHQLLGREHQAELPKHTKLTYDNLFQLIQSLLIKPVEMHRTAIEKNTAIFGKEGRSFCDELVWLLPELLVRPISRSFTLVQDIENIRTSVEKEIGELRNSAGLGANYDDRCKWLKSELDTLDKVWDEGQKLRTGVEDWLGWQNTGGEYVWQKQYKSEVEPISPWYKIQDEHAMQKESVKVGSIFISTLKDVSVVGRSAMIRNKNGSEFQFKKVKNKYRNNFR